MKTSPKKIKHLNLNPLSVVKFFYENMGERALEQPFIQSALYLACHEILKKENILLFKEPFETWETTPVLISVFSYLSKNGKPNFKLVPNITNEKILWHLEKTCQRYNQNYSELLACDLQFKANKLAGNL